MQDTDRSAIIKIGDEEYQLILTTKATKEIAKRYGGLENLGAKLMKMAACRAIILMGPVLLHRCKKHRLPCREEHYLLVPGEQPVHWQFLWLQQGCHGWTLLILTYRELRPWQLLSLYPRTYLRGRTL
jgi:hypothetical protein